MADALSIFSINNRALLRPSARINISERLFMYEPAMSIRSEWHEFFLPLPAGTRSAAPAGFPTAFALIRPPVSLA